MPATRLSTRRNDQKRICWLSGGGVKAGFPPFSSAAYRTNWQVLRHAPLWLSHKAQYLCGAGVRLVFAQWGKGHATFSADFSYSRREAAPDAVLAGCLRVFARAARPGRNA